MWMETVKEYLTQIICQFAPGSLLDLCEQENSLSLLP